MSDAFLVEGKTMVEVSEVTVYSLPSGCQQCRATKRKLEAVEVPFTEVIITAEIGDWLKSQGHQGAPVVYAGDEVWTGFNPDKINEVAKRLKEGK